MTLPIARDLAQRQIRVVHDRAGAVQHPAAGRAAGGGAHLARRAGAAPEPARRAGRVRRAGRAHRRQPDAERRGDPPGRRDPDGAALTEHPAPRRTCPLGFSLSREASFVSVHDYSITFPDGTTTSLADYAGQPLLLINVASKCGFTPQYEGLEALDRRGAASGDRLPVQPVRRPGARHRRGDRGILPTTYDVTFPVFAKIDVNGPDADPLWGYLRAQARATSARPPGCSTTSSRSGSRRRSAPTRSSGTSPSSSSTATVRSCAATSRTRPRSRSARTSPAA